MVSIDQGPLLPSSVYTSTLMQALRLQSSDGFSRLVDLCLEAGKVCPIQALGASLTVHYPFSTMRLRCWPFVSKLMVMVVAVEAVCGSQD